jgi:hypothetical protein
MKTMSWSRYHCLSWSFTRMRSHLRCGGRTRTRHAVTKAAISASAKVGADPHRSHPPAADNAGAGRSGPGVSDS